MRIMRQACLALLSGLLVVACADRTIARRSQPSIVDHPEEREGVVGPDTLYGSDSLRGDVEGIALDCDMVPIPSAQIRLSGMPRSVALTGLREVPWVFVNNPESVSVLAVTDSTGHFQAHGIPVGLYKVQFEAGSPPDKFHCVGGSVLFLRVAPDSAAIVNLVGLNRMLPIVRPLPIWTQEYRATE